jgi:D-alanyl-D-alanine carboxypeptidase (penicillin-binding protein 5/6)
MTACRSLVFLAGLLAGLAANAAPAPPTDIPAQAWVLQDALTGRVLAEHRAQETVAPAGLVNLMTTVVVLDAVARGQIALSDRVPISERAWKTPGTRMFARLGEDVTVEKLLEGLAVVSANDAAIALAEHVSGSEKSFVERMNALGAELGLENTHFANPTGFDDADQYSTAMDVTRLSSVLARGYPQYFGWYARKAFEYNTIEQYNRNALLWRDPSADGIKAGHTPKAGYCLVGSAARDGMRLIATVMGAPDELSRTEAAGRLLDYGFEAFETHRVLGPDMPAGHAAVRGGQSASVPIGVAENVYVTVARGSGDGVELQVEIPAELTAPVSAGREAGRAIVRIDGRPDREVRLQTLESVPPGGFWDRVIEWFR